MSDLFDPSGFESIRLHAAVKNKTTMKDIQPTEDCEIIVEEILDNGIVITTPGPSFARDHKVVIHLEPLGTKEKDPLVFIGSGKVIDLQTFPDHTEKVVIEWSQFDPESWSRLWEPFERRQREIEEFLAQVKG